MKKAMSNDWLGFCFFPFLLAAVGQEKHVRLCGQSSRWGEGESTANQKRSVVGVRGQPSESVKAATVGTNQSQCHGYIDQTWTHSNILSDTHAHTQYSIYALLQRGFCRPPHSSYALAHRVSENTVPNAL